MEDLGALRIVPFTTNFVYQLRGAVHGYAPSSVADG